MRPQALLLDALVVFRIADRVDQKYRVHASFAKKTTLHNLVAQWQGLQTEICNPCHYRAGSVTAFF